MHFLIWFPGGSSAEVSFVIDFGAMVGAKLDYNEPCFTQNRFSTKIFRIVFVNIFEYIFENGFDSNALPIEAPDTFILQ